ncbi:MAG TPA: stage III sporulation protein AG [Firmicutes bacterium]|nr:stage III sporulation protein AG [Bacillota bacterium]
MKGEALDGLNRWREKLQGSARKGWLLVLGLAGVLLLALGNFSPSDHRPSTVPGPGGLAGAAQPNQPKEQGPAAGALDGEAYAAQLERALAETLSQVSGAGTVSVRVFLASGPRREYARKTSGDTRTTQESDRTGTSRVTTEQHEEGEVTVMRGESGGSDVPVVVVTHLPEVRGVLVVASGAGDPLVRSELAKAVGTALNLPLHRIEVLAKEGGY